jgi:hypothetical protein
MLPSRFLAAIFCFHEAPMSKGKKDPPPPSPTPIIQAVNTPSAYEKIAEEKLNKWRSWENQTGPKDIMDAPGMGDIVDIYGNAEALAKSRRLSQPGFALSAGGNRDFQGQLSVLQNRQMLGDRAAGISRGLQGLKNEAYGLGGQAAELEAARKREYAQLSLANQQAYYNRPQKKSTWEKVAGIAMGGLSFL